MHYSFLLATQRHIFFDSVLVVIGPLFEDVLHIIVGDLGHLSILRFTVSDLADMYVPPYQNWLRLRVMINHPDIFSPKMRTSVSVSHHCPHLLGPKIYCRPVFHSFRQTNEIQPPVIFHAMYLLFSSKSFRMILCFAFEAPHSDILKSSTETVTAVVGIFCPWEKLFNSNDCISNYKLKSLRRKEHPYKSRSNPS